MVKAVLYYFSLVHKHEEKETGVEASLQAEKLARNSSAMTFQIARVIRCSVVDIKMNSIRCPAVDVKMNSIRCPAVDIKTDRRSVPIEKLP